MSDPNSAVDVDFFRTEGFLVLRQFFDPRPLTLEVDRVLSDAFPGSARMHSYDGIQFQYVPMMTGSTPVSLSLLDRCELIAAIALGGSVIPTRAKAVRYFGDTPWHVDSNSLVSSMGILAYLEPLDAETGSLRVLPGSHRQERADAVRALGGTGMPATALPSHVLATQPGDIILIDEHLAHASVGGGKRRQWRVDYISDPGDAAMRSCTVDYLANLYAPDWNGGYDVDRYPSYGPDWLASGRPAVARLKDLGVYEMASRQEAFTRGKYAEGPR